MLPRSSSKRMSRRLMLEASQYERRQTETLDVPERKSPQSVIEPFAPPSVAMSHAAAIGLRLDCAELFDERRHEYLLRDLWQRAVPGEPFSRFSHRWEEVLGFQTEDPARDLRGARALGLRQLVRFCSSGNLGVVRRGESRFPLAAASLNVTLMLCNHLGLLTNPAGGASAITPCSEDTLRNFMRLHSSLAGDGELQTGGAASSSALLDMMHEQALRWLLDRWERLAFPPDAPAGRRLMCFPRLLTELRGHVHATLANAHGPWSLGSILVALRRGDEGSRSSPPAPSIRLSTGASSRRKSLPAAAVGLALLVAWACPPSRASDA